MEETIPATVADSKQSSVADTVLNDGDYKQLTHLTRMLQNSIRDGDEKAAIGFAVDLARQKASLQIDTNNVLLTEKKKTLEIRVYVEDKDSSGVSVLLNVYPTMSIRHLKLKMLLEYGFPPEVQKWIIGKRIANDDETLFQCGVKDSNAVLVLYLISPKSIGVSKTDLRKKYCKVGQNPEALSGASEDNISSGVEMSPSPDLEIQLQSDQQRCHENISCIKQNQQSSPSTVEPSVTKQNEIGWKCLKCTYINLPTRPGCEMCGCNRPASYQVPEDYTVPKEEADRLAKEFEADLLTAESEERSKIAKLQQGAFNYKMIVEAEETNEAIPNPEPFQCTICFDDIDTGDGILLRECLHMICKLCLESLVIHSENPEVTCPYKDDTYSCGGTLQEREVRAVVNAETYRKYLERSVSRAENVSGNSYHCKTPDCPGWCFYEDDVNFFECPCCNSKNCLTCKAVHADMNCREYQDDLKIRAENDKTAQQTKRTVEAMLDQGEAMHCPVCQIILQKKDGCDWIMCTMCKTEICWVTRGLRWGPGGNGDRSGGCHCRENGKSCHQNCGNCH